MSKLLKRSTPSITKLTTTFSLPKLHQVPAWGAAEVPRAPHSDTNKSPTSSAASSARVATTDYTIDRAEPCFITNVSAYTHVQAHMINAIRGNTDAHRAYKGEVEMFLERQGIVDRLFDLDQACNLANMDPSLHSAMDKYGMFAITCSETFLDKYIEILKGENKKWAEWNALGKPYTRHLQLFVPSIRITEYELVVLQRDHFLPDDTVIFYYHRQGRTVSTVTGCKMVDGVLRQHPWAQDSPIYPAFQVRREIATYNLNPYLVILAAEIKFRRYNAANGPALPPPYDTLMRKTLEVADLLYFQPVKNRDASSVQFAIVNVDVDSRYAQDKPLDSNVASLMEFGVRTGAEGDSGGSTARQRQPAAGTRRKDADYWRHLMSGRDLELNDNDMELLREIEASNRAASSHGQSLEQVEQWTKTLEV